MTVPIIIIGCHRSGTSLLSKVLHEAGVFMGARQDENHESAFFRDLNSYILRRAGATWHQPMPLIECVHDAQLQQAALRKIRHAFYVRQYVEYWGTTGWRWPYGGLWGWKDPRTTVTLPIWLQRFPQAKVIHIFRHGVDVAHSLHVREMQLKDTLPAAWLGGLDLERAFVVWTEYETAALRFTQSLPAEQLLRMRYEDLLADPMPCLQRISSFLGRELNISADSFQADKAFAFRRKPHLVEFYQQQRQHPLMRELGYAYDPD